MKKNSPVRKGTNFRPSGPMMSIAICSRMNSTKASMAACSLVGTSFGLLNAAQNSARIAKTAKNITRISRLMPRSTPNSSSSITSETVKISVTGGTSKSPPYSRAASTGAVSTGAVKLGVLSARPRRPHG